jgi:crossover junction endodeoxyribonuclease RusA
MATPFPLEFVVAGTPVSLQGSSRGRNAWKAIVNAASQACCPAGMVPTQAPLCVSIYYFCAGPMQGDIDNIVKPILDAMCGTAYVDDQCVAAVNVRKIEPGQPIQVTNPSRILSNALTSTKPLVYVRISDDPYGEPL